MLRPKASGADAAAAAESKVQKAACSQTVAIEELAERTDEAMLARMQAEEGLKALRDTLANVDMSRRHSLQQSIQRYGTALVDAAHTIEHTAEQLHNDALDLQRATLNGSPSYRAAGKSKKLSVLRRLDDNDYSGSCTERYDAGRPLVGSNPFSDGTRDSDEDNDSPFVAPVPGRSSVFSAEKHILAGGGLCIPLSPSSSSANARSGAPSARPLLSTSNAFGMPSDTVEAQSVHLESRATHIYPAACSSPELPTGCSNSDRQAIACNSKSPKRRPPALCQLDVSDDDGKR